MPSGTPERPMKFLSLVELQAALESAGEEIDLHEDIPADQLHVQVAGRVIRLIAEELDARTAEEDVVNIIGRQI